MKNQRKNPLGVAYPMGMARSDFLDVGRLVCQVRLPEVPKEPSLQVEADDGKSGHTPKIENRDSFRGITYEKIFHCDEFHVGVFRLPKNHAIPSTIIQTCLFFPRPLRLASNRLV
eukprot:GABV01002013.1.p1 GENE.GABV01002013.1~~GABV01002013.1.p1  ORF type:complete len:115 (-),score=32.78 GABV01002013.1:233-577(-)